MCGARAQHDTAERHPSHVPGTGVPVAFWSFPAGGQAQQANGLFLGPLGGGTDTGLVYGARHT